MEQPKKRVTNISDNGIAMIEVFEGLKLKPYLCSAKVPTIGIGSTYYEDGKRVKMTDTAITKERAYELFRNTVKTYVQKVDSFTRDDINQNQFDSLVSLAYNIGVEAFRKSSVLRRVNANPNDPKIPSAFNMWVKSGRKTVKGLVIRRKKEGENYMS